MQQDSQCPAVLRHVTTRCSDVADQRLLGVLPILEGDLKKLPRLPSRTVRVFLSSTFSDMTPERNALMIHAYPKLKEFCRRKHRFEFQAVDLRWGIREQSHDDHTIIDFCLREIENCKRTSAGPYFVAFIGQKYGFRPLPPKISSHEFETVMDELLLVATNDDISLLKKWFKKDTNVVPPMYAMLPVSSILPHFTNMENPELRKAAETEWNSTYNHLQVLLRRGVKLASAHGRIGLRDISRYFVSVTELEIQLGLLQTDETFADGLCFMRSITNLEQHLDYRRAQKYIDTIMVGRSGDDQRRVVDVEAQKMLEKLRKEKILQRVPFIRYIAFFRLTWSDVEDTNPSDNADHLERFCKKFREMMELAIDRKAVALRQSTSFNQQVVEIHQHLAMCNQRGLSFRGRLELLSAVRTRLINVPDQPIVLHGMAGSGKTSVIAKVAASVRDWLISASNVVDCRPIVMLRFLGSTSRSCSIRLALGSLCWQLASIYQLQTTTMPDDYPGLVAHFSGLLQLATVDRPLIILLDGLNQLSAEHQAHRLSWLPRTIPPNVRLVLSTLTGHPTFEAVRAIWSSSPPADAGSPPGSAVDCFVEVAPLGLELSVELVRSWLRLAGRDLTEDQYKIVVRALSLCTLPLYTSLVFEEVRLWTSYSSTEQTTIERTIDDCIGRLFDRVERTHGRVFVSHALGYLTGSKDGLSDIEMEDILSLDEVVLNDVFQHWVPPVRRIPPLLIPRLQDALGCYVVQREANGTVVLYWYHSAFIGVARRRYLADEPQRRALHSTLAHYFLGTWGGGCKKRFQYSCKQIAYMSMKRGRRPGVVGAGGLGAVRGGGMVCSEDEEADRMVPRQPLHYGPDPRFPGKLNYNLRKLGELPHHLLHSGMVEELKSSVLFNYDWLHAKLSATSLHDVLQDFDQAIEGGVTDPEVGLVASALRVGGSNISANPNSLAFDLLGRLLVYYDHRAIGATACPAALMTTTLPEEGAMERTVSQQAVDSCQEIHQNGDVQNNGKVEQNPNQTSNGALTSRPMTPNHRRRLGKRLVQRNSSLFSGIRSLLQQCDENSPGHSALLPVLQCFDASTALARFVLEGHATVVSDIAFMPKGDELLSVAGDGTLAVWDLEHGGERTRTVDVSAVHPGRRVRVFPSSDGQLIVVDGDAVGSPAHIYNYSTGRLLHSFGDRDHTQGRGFLAANLFCRQRSLVDIRSGVELRTLDDFGATSAGVPVALSADGQRLLIGGPESTSTLFDVRSATVLGRMYGESPPTALALSGDGCLAFIGYSSDLCVYDISSAVYQRSSASSSSSSSCRSSSTDDPADYFPDNDVISDQTARTCPLLRKFDYTSAVRLQAPRANALHVESETNNNNNNSNSTGSPAPTKMSLRGIMELTVSPADPSVVLINGARKHLIVYDASCDDRVVVDTVAALARWRKQYRHFTVGQLATALSRSTFSGDGRLVLATTDTAIHVWRAEDGQRTRSIALHTMAGFPFAVSRGKGRNLAATGSTLHTAIRVWDLDAATSPIELLQSDASVVTYSGPVNSIAVARSSRLVFVKNHVALSTSSGYRYSDFFGIDVWNVATGRCTAFLTFGRYGRLLQMEVSPRAERLALLLRAVNDSRYVAVIDMCGAGSVLLVAEHTRCSSFLVSPEWDRIATYSQSNNEVRLWNVEDSSGQPPVVFGEAGCPVFTVDGEYLVYVDRREALVVAYSLREMAPLYRVSVPGARRLVAVPVNRRTVIVETDSRPVVATAWMFGRDGGQLTVRLFGVGSNGLLDVSKDGSLAVDGLLQVFELRTGELRTRFAASSSSIVDFGGATSTAELEHVRLTDDGRYVVWAEQLSIYVGRISDGMIIAAASTHERVVSLATMDFGYVIVAGREDGRLLTMRLAASGDGPLAMNVYVPRNAEERRQFLLDAPTCGEQSMSSMDATFQQEPSSVTDNQVPSAGSPVCDALLKRADVPHDVIKSADWTSNSFDNSGSSSTDDGSTVELRRKSNVGQQRFPSRFFFGGRTAAVSGGGADFVLDAAVTSPVWEFSRGAAQYSSANDLRKSTSVGGAAFRSRFLTRRSRSHQSLLRVDVNASSLSIDGLPSLTIRSATSTPRLFSAGRRGPMACLGRGSKDDTELELVKSSRLINALQQSGQLVITLSGVDINRKRHGMFLAEPGPSTDLQVSQC